MLVKNQNRASNHTSLFFLNTHYENLATLRISYLETVHESGCGVGDGSGKSHWLVVFWRLAWRDSLSVRHCWLGSRMKHLLSPWLLIWHTLMTYLRYACVQRIRPWKLTCNSPWRYFPRLLAVAVFASLLCPAMGRWNTLRCEGSFRVPWMISWDQLGKMIFYVTSGDYIRYTQTMIHAMNNMILMI